MSQVFSKLKAPFPFLALLRSSVPRIFCLSMFMFKEYFRLNCAQSAASARPWGKGWLLGNPTLRWLRKVQTEVASGLKSQGQVLGDKRNEKAFLGAHTAGGSSNNQSWTNQQILQHESGLLRWTAGWSVSRPGAWVSDSTHHYITCQVTSLLQV